MAGKPSISNIGNRLLKLLLIVALSPNYVEAFNNGTSRRSSHVHLQALKASRNRAASFPSTPDKRREHDSFFYSKYRYHSQSLTLLKGIDKNDEENSNKIDGNATPAAKQPHAIIRVITSFAPIWTMGAAAVGIKYTTTVSPVLGSLTIIQSSLAFLMLAMGLTITPKDLSRAFKNPSILATNAIYCFGMMPLVALGISKIFRYNTSETAGIVLLASVSGGQASNLFTLLAGGDVALSVVCTLSTTLLGAIATPLLIQFLLGCSSVNTNGIKVLQSVISLALLPLILGITLSRKTPGFVSQIVHLCPPLGVIATLILVAGGASSSAVSMTTTAVVASCLLPIVGGGMALALLGRSNNSNYLPETSKRALVIETFSKSPTLAYVLAMKHFDASTATIPAAAMVSLAVIGAAVSSIWSSFWPITTTDNAFFTGTLKAE